MLTSRRHTVALSPPCAPLCARSQCGLPQPPSPKSSLATRDSGKGQAAAPARLKHRVRLSGLRLTEKPDSADCAAPRNRVGGLGAGRSKQGDQND